MTERFLTGITTTGTTHLGNYVGAIRPSVVASRTAGVESFFFLADYHALIKCDDPERVARSRMEIAAAWLAAGLDIERATFYRQSDVPEVTELTWLLTCVTPKGLMNRAHAYKAATDVNRAAGGELDDGVSMGLYAYPILMAADILLFKATKVPVGRDQVQHIEMARDIAQRFNHQFGRGRALLVLPEAQVDESLATLPGLDGRKMSKSYDNVIPLFAGGAKGLREGVARIVTDSRLPGEPKHTEGVALVAIHDAFATPAQREAFGADLRAGLGWGDAKERVVRLVDAELAPLRERHAELLAQPQRIEDALQAGAAKARQRCAPLIAELRDAVGLRAVRAPASSPRSGSGGGAAPATFKQFREADGRFRFKLVDGDGTLLLDSEAFDDARAAGQWVKRLKHEGPGALGDAPVTLAPGVEHARVVQVLADLADLAAGAADA